MISGSKISSLYISKLIFTPGEQESDWSDSWQTLRPRPLNAAVLDPINKLVIISDVFDDGASIRSFCEL